MKQINALYNNNMQEVFGRITLKGKNVFNRSSYILVSDNEKDFSKNYKFIITSKRIDNCCFSYCIVDNISGFSEGDVVSINLKGEISFLYEINSTSNAIFATARCNHRCIMCPQPPILQEKDRTAFNLELIKLFDKNTEAKIQLQNATMPAKVRKKCIPVP